MTKIDYEDTCEALAKIAAECNDCGAGRWLNDTLQAFEETFGYEFDDEDEDDV